MGRVKAPFSTRAPHPSMPAKGGRERSEGWRGAWFDFGKNTPPGDGQLYVTPDERRISKSPMMEDSIHSITYKALDQAAWLAKRCGKFENMLTVVGSKQDWLLLFGTMANEFMFR